MKYLMQFLRDERGAVSIEFVMLATTVVGAMSLSIDDAGTILSNKFLGIVNSLK